MIVADPNVLQFTVLGKPQSQGSMKAFVIKGRPRLTSDNPAMKPWRQQVGWTALRVRQDAGRKIFGTGQGPVKQISDDVIWAGRHVAVALSVDFYFAKPPSAKKRLLHVVKPDVSKLLRAVEDAMTGIIYADDAQIVQESISKHYGMPERAEIRLERIG